MYRSWKGQHIELNQPGCGRSRRGWFGTLSLLCVAAIFVLGGIASALSQSTNEAQIIAPTLLTIKSATETGLPIRVITSHQDAFVLIKGLPKAVALSTGRLFDSGIWAVKVSELGELKIVAMVNSTEEHDLVFSLKTLDGKVLAEFKTALRITPVTGEETADVAIGQEVRTAAVAPPVQPDEGSEQPPISATPSETTKADRQPVVPAAPVLSEEDMQSILLLMRKGSENIQQGKINVARLFYTRAADKGWADAAFSLARTYDEIELEKIGAIGVQPDPELAAKWYKRAVELGSTTAVAYLERFQ